MKKSILTAGLTIILATFSMVSVFAQQNKKAKSARKDIKCAQKNLTEAKNDSVADFMEFKKEASLKIADNQKKIAELKAKKADDNKEVKEKYEAKVMSLEQKNNDLRKKMDGANETKPSMWGAFKREFNHDMEELGRAFRDVGVNNAN
jgi:flagellar biosynthesis protein FliP